MLIDVHARFLMSRVCSVEEAGGCMMEMIVTWRKIIPSINKGGKNGGVFGREKSCRNM